MKEVTKLVIFSGGTALNHLCGAFKKITTHISYIIPVSDSGGSTAEIIRVLGGPAIGDIRSRIVRLADDSTEEAQAVQNLLLHRLPMENQTAKNEWYSIVEGSHFLWGRISEPYKETIRSFLIHFNSEILKQANRNFDWGNGSIGNFFFTGARIFFNSLEAAIFWFSRVSGIPTDSRVIPIINEPQKRFDIAALLANGSLIIGQHHISHPPEAKNTPTTIVNKSLNAPLPAPIENIFYVNDDRQKCHPIVNPTALSKLSEENATIIYGIGSLYTSIIPSLILSGIGESIASKKRKKNSPSQFLFGS